jgi:hypothetical protein
MTSRYKQIPVNLESNRYVIIKSTSYLSYTIDILNTPLISYCLDLEIRLLVKTIGILSTVLLMKYQNYEPNVL